MSVITFVRKNDEVVFAADSQMSSGYSSKVTIEESKILHYKKPQEILIGCCGTDGPQHAWGKIIVDCLSKNKKFEESWAEFCFNNENKDFLENLNKYANNNSLIVYTNDKLYTVHPKGGVSRLKTDYYATGSGMDVAIGAMYALMEYNNDLTPLQIAKIGVQAACKHDVYCGLPIKTKILKVGDK